MEQINAFLNRSTFEKFIPERIMELTKNGEIFDLEEINSYPYDLEKADAHELIAGDTALSEKEQTIDFILEGGLVLQFLFAGAATRAAEILKGGSKYSFDSFTFKENAENVLLSCMEELKGLTDEKEKADLQKEINAIEKGLKEFSDKKLIDITLGARQIFQYRLVLERFAKKRGKNIDDVIKNIFFIVHINENSKDLILDDFISNNYFGFLKENIIFIIQDSFCGHVFKDGVLRRVDDFIRPFGHGYTIMQTAMPQIGSIVNEHDELVKIEKSPLGHIRSNSKKRDIIMANSNIDDLTKLTSFIVDIERINFAKKCLLDEDFDVLVEGVWNVKGQKGGSWLKDKESGKKMLVEGLCLKTKRFEELFTDSSGEKRDVKDLPLLNKMSNYYKVDSLLKWLPVKGIPNYLDIRKGVLFLESITGDITQIKEMRSQAFVKIDPYQKKPEEIKTFKGVKDVHQVLCAMEDQEKDIEFKDLVSRIKHQ
ncbi:MAG: hypothetical protein KAI43_00520 [Candidatus Aureabacteria bacterium]|nr:hypothetical protein [Candidatus Auribacterota bacterium]